MCSISLGEDLELECITIGANPPAKLRWFLGEQEIHTGHRQENSRGKTNAEIVDESKARTWTSISRLTLPVSKADNNAILRCLAEHPALLAGETLVSSKFLTIHCKFQQEILFFFFFTTRNTKCTGNTSEKAQICVTSFIVGCQGLT